MHTKESLVPPGPGFRYSLAFAHTSGELRQAALSLSQKKGEGMVKTHEDA